MTIDQHQVTSVNHQPRRLAENDDRIAPQQPQSARELVANEREVQLTVLNRRFVVIASVARTSARPLFNPARMITWAFFALYIFVAGGAWFFLARFARK